MKFIFLIFTLGRKQTMMKKATLANVKTSIQPSNFPEVEVHLLTRAETIKQRAKDADFYEIDLSDEEDRKDKKSAMASRRMSRKSAKK
jgi:hypothetical protein